MVITMSLSVRAFAIGIVLEFMPKNRILLT